MCQPLPVYVPVSTPRAAAEFVASRRSTSRNLQANRRAQQLETPACSLVTAAGTSLRTASTKLPPSPRGGGILCVVFVTFINMSKKPAVIAIVALVVAAGGFWIWKRSTANAAPAVPFRHDRAGQPRGGGFRHGHPERGDDGAGWHAGLGQDRGDPGRLQRSREERAADRPHRSHAARAGRAGCAGRPRAQPGGARTVRARVCSATSSCSSARCSPRSSSTTRSTRSPSRRANVKSAQVTLDRAQAESFVHADLCAHRRHRRRAHRGARADRRGEHVRRRSCSSSRTTCRRCRSWRRWTRATSARSSDGQNVRFSVQAYPNQHFAGQVKQVRLQSKTTENVVNYTVVVRVANTSGKLLPGMTATLEFLTGTGDGRAAGAERGAALPSDGRDARADEQALPGTAAARMAAARRRVRRRAGRRGRRVRRAAAAGAAGAVRQWRAAARASRR